MNPPYKPHTERDRWRGRDRERESAQTKKERILIKGWSFPYRQQNCEDSLIIINHHRIIISILVVVAPPSCK